MLEETKDKMDLTAFSLFFSRLSPVMTLAQERSLEISDLGVLPQRAHVKALHEIFIEKWDDEMKLEEGKRSLWRALNRTIGYKPFVLGVVLQLLWGGSTFQSPLLLKAINDSNAGINVLGKREYWTLVTLTLVIPILGTIAQQQAQAIFQFIGMQFRNVLAAAIYHKTLRRKSSQLETGLVTNMFINDVKQIEQVGVQIANVISIPAILAAALALIYQQVGVSMFVGFAFIVANSFPLGISFAFVMMNIYALFKFSDMRIKLTTEVISGIRIIKYYGWEVSSWSRSYPPSSHEN